MKAIVEINGKVLLDSQVEMLHRTVKTHIQRLDRNRPTREVFPQEAVYRAAYADWTGQVFSAWNVLDLIEGDGSYPEEEAMLETLRREE